jgi:hypothetical protein
MQTQFFRNHKDDDDGRQMMRTGGYLWVLLFISVGSPSWALGVSVIPCNQLHAAAHIAGAKSLKALNEEKKGAPSGFVIEIVATFRAFELQPQSRTIAESLLRQIPKDETQQEVVSALDAAICDDESTAEMKALAHIKYGLPRLLARAAEVAPEFMKAYINYSSIALDPHSDYAVQMQRVCRNRPQQFRKAVAALSEADRKWFKTEVLDPKSCRAIAIPEAE